LRKCLTGLASLAGVSLLAGCVYSLHPWAIPGSETEYATLIGAWQTDEELWLFHEDEEGLRLLQNEGGGSGEFRVRSFLAGSRHYLDLQPLEQKALSGFAASHILALHGLLRWRIEAGGDSLVLTSPEFGRMERLFERQPPPGEKIGDRWVLTGASEQLFAYLDAHLGADSLWTEELQLGKMR
jgi:hypothetical protein